MMQSRWKLLVYTLLAFGGVAFVLALLVLSFPDPLINTFVKGRMLKSIENAHPAYTVRIHRIHWRAWAKMIRCDSLVVEARDSTLKCSVGALSVSGVGLLQLLRGTGSPSAIAAYGMDAKDILVSLAKSHYELRCRRLRASVPDSEFVAEAVEYHPSVDDQRFFAGSDVRRTRVNLSIQQCRSAGVAFLEALDRKAYRTRRVTLHGAILNVLINKDKPADNDLSNPFLPTSILSSMKEPVQCDSVDLAHGVLNYGERFDVGAKPAMIMLDDIHVGVGRINTRGNFHDSVMIRVQGDFMKAGRTTLLVALPLSSPDYSFRYAGSVDSMELKALNPFLEIAEQKRITSGSLQQASFDIRVVGGRASGNVRAVYQDLSLAAINKETGSEKNLVDRFSSFIANNVKLRTKNVPDGAGSMKIGMVKYARKSDDPFFRFAWFALRSGVGDVVGF